MSEPRNDAGALQEQLRWVNLKDQNITAMDKIKSKGISGVLVPIGCTATVGILLSGLYFMFKGNSKKQQVLMRYRVLAQGITLCIATLSMFSVKMS